MPSTPPPPPVAIGELVANKYRVERVLGRGGMGVVVAALHEQLAQRVAIKMLLPEAEASPNALARFTREARAAATIRSSVISAAPSRMFSAIVPVNKNGSCSTTAKCRRSSPRSCSRRSTASSRIAPRVTS